MNEYHPGVLSAKQVDDIAQSAVRFMQENDLTCDMEGQQNAQGTWELLLSKENGSCGDDLSFDTEEEANKVADKIIEMIEAANE